MASSLEILLGEFELGFAEDDPMANLFSSG